MRINAYNYSTDNCPVINNCSTRAKYALYITRSSYPLQSHYNKRRAPLHCNVIYMEIHFVDVI